MNYSSDKELIRQLNLASIDEFYPIITELSPLIRLNSIIKSCPFNRLQPKQASIALQVLGETISNAISFYILAKSLTHPSPIVRDGAVLGFIYLNNPLCLNHLLRAYQNESIYDLKGDIELAIKHFSPNLEINN